MNSYQEFIQKTIYNILMYKTMNSKRYKECLEYYRKILLDFKRLYDNIPINDPLNLEILYEKYLLPNGIFSITKNFKYNMEDTLVEPIPILGAKIMSGTGVCRHIVQLFIDIAKTCDLEAYSIWVRNIKRGEGHVLIGLSDKKRRILDPTNHLIGDFTEDHNIVCIDPQSRTVQNTYSYQSEESIELTNSSNYLNIEEYLAINKDSFPNFKEYGISILNMEKLYKQYKKDFLDFKKENYENYYNISQLQGKICKYQKRK